MEGNMGVIPENSVSSFNKLIIKMILIGPVTYIVTISKEDCVKIKLWEQLFVTIYIFCRLLFCHWPTYIRGHEVSWTSWGHQLLLCCCSVARRKQGNSRIVSDVEFGIWFKTLMEFEKLSYFKYYTIGVGKLAWVNTSLILGSNPLRIKYREIRDSLQVHLKVREFNSTVRWAKEKLKMFSLRFAFF